MVVDFDDFGSNHVISDMCQAHDCRDKLLILKEINPNFKCTLFTIPWEMTLELMNWAKINEDWVELAWHGFNHHSNYECEKLTYDEFGMLMEVTTNMMPGLKNVMVKLFKAPGWQISDDAMLWLADHDWMIADQHYNDERRPEDIKAYVNHNGTFLAKGEPVEAWHGHTWNCVGNGIYETFDQVAELVRNAKDFQFVTEVIS